MRLAIFANGTLAFGLLIAQASAGGAGPDKDLAVRQIVVSTMTITVIPEGCTLTGLFSTVTASPSVPVQTQVSVTVPSTATGGVTIPAGSSSLPGGSVSVALTTPVGSVTVGSSTHGVPTGSTTPVVVTVGTGTIPASVVSSTATVSTPLTTGSQSSGSMSTPTSSGASTGSSSTGTGTKTIHTGSTSTNSPTGPATATATSNSASGVCNVQKSGSLLLVILMASAMFF